MVLILVEMLASMLTCSYLRVTINTFEVFVSGTLNFHWKTEEEDGWVGNCLLRSPEQVPGQDEGVLKPATKQLSMCKTETLGMTQIEE